MGMLLCIRLTNQRMYDEYIFVSSHIFCMELQICFRNVAFFFFQDVLCVPHFLEKMC